MRLTELQVEKLLGALAAGGEMALAARIVGISRSSLYNCMTADETLRERINEARAQADEVVIKSLYTKATQDKDVTAMIFWLKNRRPAEWRDRREIVMGVTPEQLERMSIEEIDESLRRMGVNPEKLQ